jgi:hypothetical protein
MRRFNRWQWAWLLLAVTAFLPAAYFAYQDVEEAGRVMRVQLIQSYSLWESDPAYRGTPQQWTRFAAWLLNTDQLMERVRAKHGALADQIELDFRRDTVLAQGAVVAGYLLAWALPLAVLYGGGLLWRRRWRN